jgi:ribosome biogenesis GTPase
MKNYKEEQKQSPIRKSRSRNLILRRSEGTIPENAIRGEVVSIVGNQVVVETGTEQINCVPTGTIISSNKHSNLIATGDIVFFISPEDIINNNLSKIVKIEDRITKFSRVDPANTNREQIIAANIDTLLIFVSTYEPILNTRFIDRYLVTAYLSNITPIICVNKIELAKKPLLYKMLAPYKKMGYSIHYISALEGEGIESIKKKLLNRRSVISGPSGAGKSTFLNKILGYSAQAISEISERTNKGTHTTSFSKLYRLESEKATRKKQKGYLIDTPGLREFGIWDLSKSELGVVFPDFLEYYPKCRYTSCTHTHEPECSVIDAVEQGLIEEERYLSYLNIYDTLEK